MPKFSRCSTTALLTAALLSLGTFAMADSIGLGQLDLTKLQQDWGNPQADKTVDGNTLTLAGQTFEHGLGTHASSTFRIDLAGNADKFTATVGMDDEKKNAADAKNFSIEFTVFGDNKTLFHSGAMHIGAKPKDIDVDLKGIKTLILTVTPRGSDITNCHGDWANATITYTGEKPKSIDVPKEESEILTPKPGPQPRVNGAKIVGVRPTHPLLFHVPVTGDRPMKITADNLPEGLSLDENTGNITGTIAKADKYVVHLHASNAAGKADRDLTIDVGDRIALTPPMGWNSWNCFANAVSDEKVRAAADAMVNAGLIEHGWTYVNMDDCWEIPAREPGANRRDENGMIKTNKKFPDMKALTEYIHAKGLKAGLYSSPGPATCANFTASYQFEEKDAQQYAAWGFDYLKYDWCSYGGVADKIKHQPNAPSQLDIFKDPYILMGNMLKKQNRDIVFSLCQYGMGSVWNWGESVNGNCWRTTGDITDTWSSMSGIGFSQNGHETGSGPGHWNDPDMLVVGKVGWGPQLHQTRLTPNEQYTHITLWSLLDSPLLIGCDMTQLDEFTTNLLTNDEVIAVNQDSLGKQAVRVAKGDNTEVWAKDMEDGSKAIGLFNRAEVAQEVHIKFSDLGLTGSQNVRDLWRQKDLGSMDEYKVTVPRHGAAMIKASK